MKFTFFLLTATFLHASAIGTAQSTITLSAKKMKLEAVFEAIEKQSGFAFFYNDRDLKHAKPVTVNLKETPLQEALNAVLKSQPVDYNISGKTIVIIKKVIGSLTDVQTAEPRVSLNLFRDISGKITNENGEPLAGATVSEKGTGNSVVTKEDGSFIIKTSNATAILVISYVGYNPKEVLVNNQVVVNVSLSQLNASLNDIVVVGYGSQFKRDVLGSISSIEPEKIGGLNAAPTFDAALQGQAAGVSVQSQTGVPGAPTKIMIRGANSINSSTDPLWIIDGMPVNQGPIGAMDGTVAQNPLSLINANDIESIQILKDAASTAVYGSRASNGVVIITTKSAKKGKAVSSISIATGISDLTRSFENIGYANTAQWFQIMDMAYNNAGRGNFDIADYFQASPKAFTQITREEAMRNNTNWFDKVFRKGAFTDVNFSNSKAFEGGSYYFSANYRDDKGVMLNNRLKRYSVRANVEFLPIKNLTIGARLSLSASENSRSENTGNGRQASDNGNSSGQAGGITTVTNMALPWMPVYNPSNPNEYYNAYSGANAAAYSDPKNLRNHLQSYRALGGVYGEYKISAIPGLSVRSEFSYDVIQGNTSFWVNKNIRLNGSNKPSNLGFEQSSTVYSYNYNAYATLNKSFGLHSLNVVTGAEAQRGSQYNRESMGEDLVGSYQQLGRPPANLYMFGGMTGEGYLMGYFSRANYKYNNKYLLGASFRRDGSSNFTEENRWGNFAAVSAGWILSDESFMSFLGKGTFLKLRASYGQTGNQGVPGGLNVIGFNGFHQYGSVATQGVNGTLPSNIAVSTIRWEKTNTTDVGIDFRLWNGRISGSAGYYQKYVKGMLLQGPIPWSAGIDGGSVYNENASRIWANIGDMSNTGYELQLTSINMERRNFRWTTSFNIATNKNVIKKLTPEADKTGKGILNGTTVSRTGSIRNEWYMADFAGIDPNTGIEMIYVVDTGVYRRTGETRRMQNSKGRDSVTYATGSAIRNNAFTLTGKSADPKYYGGITNTFEYNGFDLSALVTFSGGNYINDYDEQVTSYPMANRMIRAEVLEGSWKKPGDIAKYAQLRYRNAYVIDGAVVDDFPRQFINLSKYLYKGDFVRLKNVQFGYTFPASLFGKMKIQSLRVYVAGTNLLTKTDYKGWDPEGATEVYTAQIPQLKTVTFGLNFRF
ncbi:MAG TPA: SusC/RagA family TonB-linked outer membrane protein [Chitinophagaceae bacterium]|nr:SusC/RagA family TonB-linked outer membrane protein [Chitinophagaceae bacterium]